MKQYQLNEAKANFSALVAAVEKGEEVVITRYGKPIARLTGIEKARESKKRELGFYPIDFKSDLLEPTDPAVIDSFYRGQ